MALDVNSRAAAVGASVSNVQFQSEAAVVERKILIIGTYDPLKTTITDGVPVQIYSANDAADKYGFGSMIHRLAMKAFLGSNGVKTYVCPQAEAGGAAAAAGTIVVTGSTGILAGTLALYVAGESVPVTVTDALSADDLALAIVAAINADTDLPVTAAINGGVSTQVDVTAKTKGTWGNFIDLSLNLYAGDVTPTGITAVLTDPSSGSGLPDIQDALDGTGTGDDANEDFFTDVIHGYLQDGTTLNAVRDYVGAGNTALGLYGKTVARPFRSLNGDTVAGSGGLSALVALGDGRKTDRASGIIAVPGSASHPAEIAAQALGIMARLNNNRAEESYVGQVLTGVHPGAKSDRWTSDYDNRNTAVTAGISPTKIESGAVTMQNVMTFYHPDSVPAASNGYASMRNISITQNVLVNVKAMFSQERFQGVSIVDDVTKVTTVTDRQKAMDTALVKDYLTTLVQSFESKAWIYQAAFTLDRLASASAVTIRSGTTGFDIVLDLLYSGEGWIYDSLIQFDTSIAILG